MVALASGYHPRHAPACGIERCQDFLPRGTLARIQPRITGTLASRLVEMGRRTLTARNASSQVSQEELMNQAELARYFRELHKRRPLILPNAWDAGSAPVIEAAGAAAIATTSAGVSWCFGRSDGQKLRREQMIQAVCNIVESVDIPVTADIESGYGSNSAADVAETVRALISIGVAGINLEDSPGHDGQGLLSPEDQAERICIARDTAEAGGDLVINARTDVYLFGFGEPERRLEAVAKSATLYRAHGADCVFVPGVVDTETITALAKAIEGPLNIMATPGAPSVSRL